MENESKNKISGITAEVVINAIHLGDSFKNISLGYPIIVFTDHKNSNFNGLKASDRVLRWLLLLEEYGIQFQCLSGMKNVVADALSRLDIEDIARPVGEIATLMNAAEKTTSEFPIHTALIYQEQLKTRGLKEKESDKPHYSLQNIEGYDQLCPKDKKKFPGTFTT